MCVLVGYGLIVVEGGMLEFFLVGCLYGYVVFDCVLVG